MNQEQIEKLVNPILEAIKSFEDLRAIAPQFEVALGGLEREGRDPADLDNAWQYFMNNLLNMLPDDFDEAQQMTANLAESGLRDNFFNIAVATIVARDEVKELPLLAWAAFNKNQYQGWKDEIAVVRALIAAGFDPNIPDSSGNTALHYMAYWDHPPHTSSRGVRMLLQNGANPNAQNRNGDTPLTYMAGSSAWYAEMSEAAAYILSSGADPYIPSGDGETAMSLLKQLQGREANEAREALIVAIEEGRFQQ
jgi:hypothetical protein